MERTNFHQEKVYMMIFIMNHDLRDILISINFPTLKEEPRIFFFFFEIIEYKSEIIITP